MKTLREFLKAAIVWIKADELIEESYELKIQYILEFPRSGMKHRLNNFVVY